MLELCIHLRWQLRHQLHQLVVRFSVDETFLRANPLDRLAVTEKMLELGLIDINQAKAMEDLTPDGDVDEDTNF